MSNYFELAVNYFHHYGYYILFLALLLENFFILGLIVPGESVLLIASFLAAQNNLSIIMVVLIATLAAILGNTLGYLIGKEGGKQLRERFGERALFKERLRASEAYFELHGAQAVFIGRFAAGIRVFIPLIAGASKMNFGRFLGYTVASTAIWTTGVGILGFFFGRNWQLLIRILTRFGWSVAIILIGVLLFIYWRKGRAR
jgi:membrane protein DedA with SNARE-associated domain